MSQRLAISAALTVGGVVVAATTAMAVTSAAPTAPNSPPAASALAAKNAESIVAGRPSYLHAGADEAFVQRSVVSSSGLQYVPYERTYRGLPSEAETSSWSWTPPAT